MHAILSQPLIIITTPGRNVIASASDRLLVIIKPRSENDQDSEGNQEIFGIIKCRLCAYPKTETYPRLLLYLPPDILVRRDAFRLMGRTRNRSFMQIVPSSHTIKSVSLKSNKSTEKCFNLLLTLRLKRAHSRPS